MQKSIQILPQFITCRKDIILAIKVASQEQYKLFELLQGNFHLYILGTSSINPTANFILFEHGLLKSNNINKKHHPINVCVTPEMAIYDHS